MMTIFRKRLRRATIFGCSALCAIASANNFFVAATGSRDTLFNIIVGVLLLGFAFAIFRQNRWALGLVAAVCLLAAVFIPIGVLNPFTAGDYFATGTEPPPVKQTLLWLIPIEVLLLAIVYIIDPRRKQIDPENS